MINNYNVAGMHCEHCVHAVTEEVSAIPGVQQVDVQLEKGSLAVTSETPIDLSLIEAAVDEAGGYTVTAA
ncbi:heavy-metal-associated domain-containing protein [Microlunatus sp. Gsoil 973]|uniref:heavy-metal-associated domain-containing protein n=1 Tax=Microlunatus sp. Gsoil 973 TaxID=2672569 RepID=UPI0012B4AAD5|nr:heavy metal-associated domain-containing protein [Microlunatus sp. Gsoil 973]QGN34574.1 heavy metal transporter [Microlunatus sp. Gsoil 973]